MKGDYNSTAVPVLLGEELLTGFPPTVVTNMAIFVTEVELLSENGACSSLNDCRLIYLT